MNVIDTSVPEEELDLPEGETLEVEAPDAAQAAIEARARDMGWHPFAEYRGPPGKWVDAATFVERGETILPIMKANNHRLEERVKKLGDIVEDQSRTISEQRQVLEEMRTLARNADDRGYKRALAELKEKQDAAEEAGDIKVFKQVSEQIDELKETRAAEAPKPSTEPPPVPPQAKPDPAVAAFMRDNPWWGKDQFLSRQMLAQHEAVMVDSPDMALADQLDEALSNLKRAFPNRFDDEEPPVRQPTRRAASVAQPSSAAPAPRRQTTGIDTIADPSDRAEARKAFDKMKRQMPDFTEAEYMAVYSDPHADVLTMRRSAKESRNARA